MGCDGFLEGVNLLFGRIRRRAVHFGFDTDAQFFCDVAQSRVGFLPVRQINVRGDQYITLIFFVVRLLAAGQRRSGENERPQSELRTGFHR